ncbi:MAG TPA: MBL fold metallo-hydrolase [Vicinamibacterales bacterium]|jgi:metallo-beta-lactamase class B|nr:MBL fold metallo-hydrolase [Vicinamibacterales bacterium]
MRPALRIGLALVLSAGVAVLSAQAPAAAPPQTVEGLVAAASQAAGTNWAGTFMRLCIPPPPAPGRGGARGAAPAAAATPAAARPAPAPPARETWYAEPAKVADNLYFIGTQVHNAWALVGSDGIIVLEALFDYAAPEEVIGGMKKVGLDPQKVKYIIISHAHSDHDGGAHFLQDSMPTAHLVYGGPDWDAVEAAANHQGGKPKRDVTATDGQKFTVGDTSLQVIATPGHTPGTLSFLFEVKDHGKPLRVAYVGGTAIPFNGTAAYYDTYLASERKMAKAAADFGATAFMSNHSEFDNAFFKAHTADDRKHDEPNPFEVGKATVARYFTVVDDCASAAKLRAAQTK